MLNRMTIFILAAITLGLIGWDFFVGFSPDGDTISKLMVTASREVMLLPFAWGVLGGHLFAFRTEPTTYRTTRILILVGIACAVGVWDLFVSRSGTSETIHHLRYPGLMVLLGVPFGHLLWPQVSNFPK